MNDTAEQHFDPFTESIGVPVTNIKRSEKIAILVAGLAKSQVDFEAIQKTSDNPFYASKYADLAAVLDASRPHLSKNGIAMMHFPQSDIERQVAIMTVGLYKEEQFIELTAEAPATGRAKKDQNDPTAPATKFDVQTLGACWTYLRRYLTQGLLALASEDDDGNTNAGSVRDQGGKPASAGRAPNPQRTTPAQATQAPEPKQDPGTFLFMPPDRLTCVIRSVVEKVSPKKTPYLNAIFNGYHQTFNFGSCWDKKLFNALRAGVGKECQLKIGMSDGNKFINITDVLYVDGVPYDLGEPSGQQEPLPE